VNLTAMNRVLDWTRLFQHGQNEFRTSLVSSRMGTGSARFWVLTAVLLKIRVFCDATLRRWANSSRRFEGTWRLNSTLLGLLDLEGVAITILRKAGNYLLMSIV
jgi:hypothetical protein